MILEKMIQKIDGNSEALWLVVSVVGRAMGACSSFGGERCNDASANVFGKE